MKRLSLWVFAGVMAGTLASCAGAPAAPAPTSPLGTPEASADAPEASTDAPPPAAADARSCVHGTWHAENAFFLEQLREFGDEVQSVSGEVRMHFDADGTLTTEYLDWLITAEVEGMEVQISRVGTDMGSYRATEGTLSIDTTAVGSVLTVSAAGSQTPVDPLPTQYADVPYTCSDSQALITTPDGSLELRRS